MTILLWERAVQLLLNELVHHRKYITFRNQNKNSPWISVRGAPVRDKNYCSNSHLVGGIRCPYKYQRNRRQWKRNKYYFVDCTYLNSCSKVLDYFGNSVHKLPKQPIRHHGLAQADKISSGFTHVQMCDSYWTLNTWENIG